MTATTLIHNTLNPKRFGASFLVENVEIFLRGKRFKTDMLIVVSQVRPWMAITENMVWLHRITPLPPEAEYVKLQEELKKLIVHDWNR